MYEISVLSGEKARQVIDTEQVYLAWKSASAELAGRYAGSMAFKNVAGRDYLYRKTGKSWKSLGPRTEQTENTFTRFHQGRQELRSRTARLAERLNELAAVNRAMDLGRMPLIAARILRALDAAKLMGSALDVAGTHCLFAYERMAGVRIDSQLVATGDLLFDMRTNLRLLARHMPENGWLGLLTGVDRSFRLLAKGGFRAVNKDGFFVDLITPAATNPMKPKRPTKELRENDLTAVEIEGLVWLVSSPKIEVTVLDARGFPLTMTAPDPRSFALHKMWMSERDDRDPLKRRRDKDQAHLVANLIASHLPHLRFDETALQALPLELRQLSTKLAGEPPPASTVLEPDW